MLNAIDTALQSAVPTVMVPRHQSFEPLQKDGHRFLATGDGLWLEARRPWLYLRWPLAAQAKVAMPYGTIKKELTFATAPSSMVDAFIAFAKEQFPLECAAWVTWKSVSNEWRFIRLAPKVATAGSVVFDRPSLAENEHLVIDLHSHGQYPAFFSKTDDTDDRGEFKIAGVFGHIDGAIESKFRLCANGLYVTLDTNGGQ